MMWVAIAILAVCAAVLAVKACLGMSTADRAENLVRDLTNADRIWRESTALKAINGSPCVLTPPEDAPRATAPTPGAGFPFDHSFHAAIPSQKGRRDNV